MGKIRGDFFYLIRSLDSQIQIEKFENLKELTNRIKLFEDPETIDEYFDSCIAIVEGNELNMDLIKERVKKS